MTEPPTVQLPALMTAPEAAKSLRVSTRTLWQHTCPRGRLACVRIGQRCFYLPGDLAAFVALCREGPA